MLKRLTHSLSPQSSASAREKKKTHVQNHSKDVSIQAAAAGLSILSDHVSLTEARARGADGLRTESTGDRAQIISSVMFSHLTYGYTNQPHSSREKL